MNMSYCRFRNTLQDLIDCEEALDFGAEQDDKMSDEERQAMVRLIKTCRRIGENNGGE